MDVIRYKEILDAVREQPDLAPVIDTNSGAVIRTYCNVALDRVMGLMGVVRMIYPNGQPMMANDMCQFMKNNPDRFTQVAGEIAVARAHQGILVIACQEEEGHGHVAPVLPMGMQISGSWGKEVPMLSNVGKINGVLRASQCFKTEPEYFSIKI